MQTHAFEYRRGLAGQDAQKPEILDGESAGFLPGV